MTLDGQPVVTGTIRFTPIQPDSSSFAMEGGASINYGKFSMPRGVGLVPGTYKVSINSVYTIGERPTAIEELIPLKYNAQSTLTVDIVEGGLTKLSFDLRSK